MKIAAARERCSYPVYRTVSECHFRSYFGSTTGAVYRVFPGQQSGRSNGDGKSGWGNLGATPDAAVTQRDHRPVFPFNVRHWRGKARPPDGADLSC